MTGIILDMVLGPLGGVLAGAVAVVVAYLTGRWGGAKSAWEKAQRKDYENAREIERRADRIRAALDRATPDERLRKYDGALRDE